MSLPPVLVDRNPFESLMINYKPLRRPLYRGMVYMHKARNRLAVKSERTVRPGIRSEIRQSVSSLKCISKSFNLKGQNSKS